MIGATNTSMAVNAVNLKSRTDRKLHIQSQFETKAEFSLNIIPAIEHKVGAYGLWQTIQSIVRNEIINDSEYFILCEDDHEFTEQYSHDFLKDSIQKAIKLDVDLLSGGVSWLYNGIQVSENLFWIEAFTGMQFTIIFNRFYKTIVEASFGEEVIADLSISSLTDKKFVIYPFISNQKEFGYSDVTLKNNTEGYVKKLFDASSMQLDSLNKVKKFYFPELIKPTQNELQH